MGAMSINAGLRYDEYRSWSTGASCSRASASPGRVPGRDVVLRASYNRNYQTPPNENLLLSNSEAARQLAPDSVREALGGTYQPIRSGTAGRVRSRGAVAGGRRMHLDVSAYRKGSRDQQDNNNFFDTGIIFPTTLRRIDVTGAEARVIVRTGAACRAP